MNSNHDYSLVTDYMWYKMILESFKSQTSKNNPLGYFKHQHKIRNDVFVDHAYFFKTCKEHTVSLKKAFKSILENDFDSPILDPVVEQVYKSEFVFGCDKGDEFTFFNDDKIPLIQVEDFDKIIKTLNEVIVQHKGSFIKTPKKISSGYKPKSFKYKNFNRGSSNLTDLMNRLKENNLIADDTSLSNFRKVFSGESINKRIVWTGNISQLSYFIKQLHNELELVENLKQRQWTATINCFVKDNGESYERNKLRWQQKPATSRIIDSLLNTLK